MACWNGKYDKGVWDTFSRDIDLRVKDEGKLICLNSLQQRYSRRPCTQKL
ncbi:hypothetical protein J4727_19470 [Providencia rettgeri]|uniref:Uncharacterized protein n=1 Tax=Providencia rettgeri TaxID=587 RepID=A0A939NL53_PRORE|nr:hypothetical protein [Providencia rettgeri]